MTQPKNVRIFRAVKSAMQSGRAGAGRWVLEGETEGHRAPDSLMGWTGGTGTAGQVRLVFPGREQAVAFAMPPLVMASLYTGYPFGAVAIDASYQLGGYYAMAIVHIALGNERLVGFLTGG